METEPGTTCGPNDCGQTSGARTRTDSYQKLAYPTHRIRRHINWEDFVSLLMFLMRVSCYLGNYKSDILGIYPRVPTYLGK